VILTRRDSLATVAPAPPHEDRMSDAEGLMWRLDRDPALSGTFGNLTILDRAPDFARVRSRLALAAGSIARLHQRVQPAPANVSPPQWVADTGFDLDYHVRRIALPKPGTMEQLRDLAALLIADPLERTRPLWQFVVIEGLRGGRAAVLQKLHHSVADGETGLQLTLSFIDLERDAPDPEPMALPDTPPSASTEPAPPSNTPSGIESLTDLLGSGLRLPLNLMRQVRGLLGEATSSPAAAEQLRMLVAQLTDLGKAQSPLWTERSLRRGFETLQFPLDDLRASAKRLGGTLNVALLTAVADATGAYHREFDAPVETLRASMAISTRTEESGNNAFTLARLTVPTAEMPPGERFALVKEAAEAARAASSAAPLERLAGFASTLPSAVLTRIARIQSQTVDFATSNLRAAPIPVFVGGAAALANYPLGPIAGVAFNLTAMSYNGSLDMGVHLDRAAIEHPDRLRKHLEQSFRRLSRARS